MARTRTPHHARRRVRFGRRLVIGLGVVVTIALVAGGFVIFSEPRALTIVESVQGAASVDGTTQHTLVPAARPVSVVAFGDGCVSAECHSAFVEAPSVHAPVAEEACETCHAPDSGDHVYPQRRTIGQVCLVCHDAAGQHMFEHQAMSDDACLACHDPHLGQTSAMLIGNTIGSTCVKCHPSSNGGNKHAPYEAGRCESCHEPHGAENRAMLLGGEGVDHCSICHAPTVSETMAGDALHADLRGSCLACHSAHSAEEDALLVANTSDLCASCHQSVSDTLASTTVSHDPVLKDRQCVSCHDPHDARFPNMLRDSQQDVCLSCHDVALEASDGRTIPSMAEAMATSPVIHGAVRRGDCSACHSVHGGTHARLLREVDMRLPPGGDNRRHYALCFACHDSGLVEAIGSTFFRDGDQNLHEVHLLSSEGSSTCNTCHVVHTGNRPRLIAETLDYEGSGWSTPMGFEITIDGGSCAPSCHEPLSYRRTPLPPPIGGSP